MARLYKAPRITKSSHRRSKLEPSSLLYQAFRSPRSRKTQVSQSRLPDLSPSPLRFSASSSSPRSPLKDLTKRNAIHPRSILRPSRSSHAETFDEPSLSSRIKPNVSWSSELRAEEDGQTTRIGNAGVFEHLPRTLRDDEKEAAKKARFCFQRTAWKEVEHYRNLLGTNSTYRCSMLKL